MTDYVISPPPQPALAIAGSTKVFPVRRIWCVGRNYLEHIKEMGHDEREPPFFFAKPADAIVPDGGKVPFPPVTKDLHFEVELVVALKSGGRHIPIAKALDDALLVYAQNGERLRPEQGYPLRLFLPGYEGNTNVKWLRRLKLGDQPFQTREETSKYTDLMPDGTARQFTFVMEAKSVITFPSGGQLLRDKGFYEISGLAWSGRGRITRVDVSTDGGASWKEARRQQPVLAKCLTRFRLSWNWDGAPAQLQSRAVDETGYTQPTRAQLVDVRGLHSSYHYNAIQAWRVAQDGAVTNVV